MKKLYKCSEFQGSSGQWYCNDVEDLTSIAAKWWIPARILNISLTDFILLLKDTFKVTNLSYRNETLIFSWDNLNDCRKYKNYINRIARERNYKIEKGN